MKFEIMHRWNNTVKVVLEGESRDAAIKKAIQDKVDLRDSNLSGSDLEPIRDDLWAVLSAAPHEVKGLRQAIIDGKIDGSTYEGKCACLVGTIAKVAGKGHRELPILKPNANRPAEAFFTAIKPGNTPQTNQASKLALEWIDEWLKNIEEAFAK